jgi:hypothetical protein
MSKWKPRTMSSVPKESHINATCSTLIKYMASSRASCSGYQDTSWPSYQHQSSNHPWHRLTQSMTLNGLEDNT